MSSRDFGYITLRNIAAYQTNGNPVPPNQVLVTSGNGTGGFTNSLIISTICVSTVEVSTIFIDRESASSINTNYLTVNSTTSLSTTTINNTLALIGNTPADSEIWLNNYKSRLGTSDPYGGLYLEASTTTSIWFSNIDATAGPYAEIGQGQSAVYGSLNVASTLTASTLNSNFINTNQISTSNITTNFVSTFNHISLFDGTSSVILDAQGSTLYVNGHPIISGGGISSVSSLFWLPGTGGASGIIYNENIGTPPNYYMVGIGTGNVPLNATLDVAGTIKASSYVSTNNIRMDAGAIYLNSGTIFDLSGINNSLGGGPINTVDTDIIINAGNLYLPDSGNTYFISTNTLRMNNGYIGNVSNIDMTSLGASNGQIVGLSTINGIAWPAVDDALWSGSLSGNIYNDNSINVGIGTNSPAYKLDVFGEARYYSTLQNSTFTLLLENQGATSTSTEIYMGTGNGAYGLYATQSGGSPIGTGLLPSTFQIYSYYSNPLNIFTLYPNGITQFYNNLNVASGNVGIGTTNPQSTLTVMGSCFISSGITIEGGGAGGGGVTYGSLKVQGGIDENSILIQDGTSVTPATGTYNGYFIGNSVNFGGASTFQIGRIDGSAQQNKAIYMTQTGNVGINTFTPQFTLDVNGSINTNSYISTTTIIVNNGGVGFNTSYNINPLTTATSNINIGTTNDPTIGLGSAGSNKTHTVNGNLSIIGAAISRVSVTYATTGTTLDSTYWGKYVFANNSDAPGYSLTLGTTAVPDGTVIVIRNAAITTNFITINGVQSGPTTILPTKTTSYVYTNASGNVTGGWYAL